MQIIIIGAYVILTVAGLIFIKLGSDSINIALEAGKFNFSMGFQAIAGFSCYIASFLIYTLYIIRKFDLTYIVPLMAGIVQVVVVLAGIFILKEHLSIPAIIGIVLVIIGTILLNTHI